MASVRTAQILTQVTGGSAEPSALPRRLVDTCAREIPVTGVGLMLMNDNGPAGMIAATDGPASIMEDLQFTLGQGPCVDCSQEGRAVLVPDLERIGPGRWPAFTDGAVAAGIRAIFALPLRIGGIRLGVLDLYRDETGMLSEAELSDAVSFADAATTILLQLQADQSASDSGMGAIVLIEDRAEVHQATGSIAVSADVSLAEALVLLRARAFSLGRPINEVARDVLSGDERIAGDSHDYQQRPSRQ